MISPELNMARMHARRKGKAGSVKPFSQKAPDWMERKPEEIEAIIIKLAKQGNQSAKIGLILRDSYGVPDVKIVLGKKLTKVLQEKGLATEEPENIVNLKAKLIKIKEHRAKHKKDMVSKRGEQLVHAKVSRLTNYYKKK
jgi:small subunit ribosomal protein S15